MSARRRAVISATARSIPGGRYVLGMAGGAGARDGLASRSSRCSKSIDHLSKLVGLLAAPSRRIGRCAAACDLIDAARQIVKSRLHVGKIFAVRIVPCACKRRRSYALLSGLLQDDGVEPFVQRQACPASRFFCGLASFRSNAFDARRKAKFHAHTHIRGGGVKSRIELSWNRRALTAGRYGARSFVHEVTFCW